MHGSKISHILSHVTITLNTDFISMEAITTLYHANLPNNSLLFPYLNLFDERFESNQLHNSI